MVTVFTLKILLPSFPLKLSHCELKKKKKKGMRPVREQTSKKVFREKTREVCYYFLSKDNVIDKQYIAQIIFQKSVCLLVQVSASLGT